MPLVFARAISRFDDKMSNSSVQSGKLTCKLDETTFDSSKLTCFFPVDFLQVAGSIVNSSLEGNISGLESQCEGGSTGLYLRSGHSQVDHYKRQVLSYVPHPPVEPLLHFFANAFCSYFCLNFTLCLEQCPHSLYTPRRLSQRVANTYPKIVGRTPLAGCFTAFFCVPFLCAFFGKWLKLNQHESEKPWHLYQSSFLGI